MTFPELCRNSIMLPLRGVVILSLAGASFICALPLAGQHIAESYRLKKVIPVAGRQGIAVDSSFYYVSDTKALYKYDKSGEMAMCNDQPFQNPQEADHFGDIDIYNGEIYCGIEKFEYGRGHNIAISVYDAETLQWKRDLSWCPESGQVEVSGLAIDRERGMVWISDWVDSRYVYCYDLDTGSYYTKMQCRPAPFWCQGIFIADGKMLFSADDGEALYHIPDNIYIADISKLQFSGLTEGEEPLRDTPFSVKLDNEGKVVMRQGAIAAGAMAGRLTLFREMTDFIRAGEIEGLAIDPANDDLIVLNNRGTRIVLGMSQGALTEEGYTQEIHELYVYEKE